MALLRTALLLLREKSREVVKAVIGFVKVAVSAMRDDALREELPHIVRGLLLWAGESKNRFRLKVCFACARVFVWDCAYVRFSRRGELDGVCARLRVCLQRGRGSGLD